MRKNVFILVGLALLAFGAACERETMSIETSSTIPVRVSELAPQSIQETVTATGTAFPVRDLSLSTEQAGRYQLRSNPRTGVGFRMGDAVRAGEVLVALDNPEAVFQ